MANGPDREERSSATPEVKPSEVGATHTAAWLRLFNAADCLVGLDVDAQVIERVLRTYLVDEWWGGDPFVATPPRAP